MIDATTILRRLPDVRYRHVPPETVLIRQKEAEVLVLEGSGGRILDLVDGKRPLSQIVDLLETEFDAERGELERDVHAFAEELLESGVVEVVEGEP